MDSHQAKILDQPCGPLGYGLMGLTWRVTPNSFDQSISVMKRALELGANNWNGGELYGSPDKNSLHLLNEYFLKYPEDADKVILNIKGGCEVGSLMPNGSEKNVRRSVEDCLALLKGTTKTKIDIFECARVDPTRGISSALKVLVECEKEGKIRGIGLSEVSAKTIRKAQKELVEDLGHAAGVASVEVELSLWNPDPLQNGIIATCAELNIPIFAYSPLARGALTDKPIRSNADIPDTDFRKHLPKFQDSQLAINNQITDAVAEIAQRRGVTLPQIAIAWVRGLSGRKHTVVFEDGSKKMITVGTVIPIPGATTVERVEENFKNVILSEEEMKALDEIVDKFPTEGDRYPKEAMSVVNG